MQKVSKMHYIIVIFEALSKFAMRIKLTHVDPVVVKFINERKDITIKGVRFIKNDNMFMIKSANGKIVGEIQGLSGISPNKQVTIHTKDPTLIDKIKVEVIIALQALVDVVKYFDSEVIFTPSTDSEGVIVMVPKGEDIPKLLSNLKVSVIDSPSLDAPVRYSNHN